MDVRNSPCGANGVDRVPHRLGQRIALGDGLTRAMSSAFTCTEAFWYAAVTPSPGMSGSVESTSADSATGSANTL